MATTPPAQPEPTVTALRSYHRQVAAMMADQDLTGDLLLVGLYMAWYYSHHGDTLTMTGVATALFPQHVQQARPVIVSEPEPVQPGLHPDRARLERVMRADIRRYDWTVGTNRSRTLKRCMAPLPRAGRPCGGTNHHGALLTDVLTGERSSLATCSKHHDWFVAQLTANRAAVAAAGDTVPRPAANAGGVLARHIPDIDWPEYWHKLDPAWTPPPEVETWQRPTLRLLTSDQADLPAARSTPRPVFTVLPGGAG